MQIVTIRYERRVNTHDYDNTVYAADGELVEGEDNGQAMALLAAAVVAWAATDLVARYPDKRRFVYAVVDEDIRRAAGVDANVFSRLQEESRRAVTGEES